MSNGDESTVHAGTPAEQGSRGARLDEHELTPEAVAARFRWARARGQPFWLWPHVSETEWRRALVELQRIAQSLLDGHRPVIMSNVLSPGGVTVAAYTSGLGPWLGWQCEQGWLLTGAELEGLLGQHLDHARRRSTALLATLRQATHVAAPAPAGPVVLKGMHSAHVYFAEPALRPLADIDLLFDGSAVHAVEAALADAGYREQRDGRLARPHRTEWRAPHATHGLRSLTLTHADDPVTLDVHGSLDIDFYGVRTVPFDAVWAGMVEPADWLAPGAAVLQQPLLAAHHAVHASQGLHGLTLLRLVELTLMVRRDMRTGADWRALGELLRELDAERFAYPAFALTAQLAPFAVEPAFLAGLAAAAPPRLRQVVQQLTPAGAQRLSGLALSERFMYARGAREHVKRAAFMLVPTGVTGSLKRLADIYINRGFRLARRRVSWHNAG